MLLGTGKLVFKIRWLSRRFETSFDLSDSYDRSPDDVPLAFHKCYPSKLVLRLLHHLRMASGQFQPGSADTV